MGFLVTPLPPATAVALEDVPRLLESRGFSLAIGLAHALLRDALAGGVLALATFAAFSALAVLVVAFVLPAILPAVLQALGIAILALRLALDSFAKNGSDLHCVRVLRCR